mmetsp:Transcript_24020/g.58000  ORF Transcript_24020/g.58000 Transcript_24020/m.58000 type:complete len:388 (+) Transcript_24020:148-1311(+)
MMLIQSASVIATVLMSGQSLAFSSLPTQQSRQQISAGSKSSALDLSANDEVQQLLAKAKALREEAAAMSGQTVEEMEQEVQREKELAQERQAVMEKARMEREEGNKSRNNMQILPVPDDAPSMIQQAASAVERAYADGIVRQTVRFALLGEEEAMSGVQNEWPGGVEQMYREAGRPLTESLLSEVRAFAKDSAEDAEERETLQSNRMPPEVRAEDIWGFDGSAKISSQSAAGSRGDVTAVVFPNTDTKYLKDIESFDKEVGPDRLLLLVNPFWRDVESWGFNILAPNGKKRAQEVIFDNGYDVTYAVLRFSARGEDCVALKSYPFDWQMYAYREDPSWFNQEVPVWLGSSKEEPKSSQFSELLNSRPEFKMSKNMRQMQRMMGNDDQ